MKMFIPHGYCASVHVGGHAQTGGYGQLNRAFGLMCDHIEGFEIVLANGEHKKVWKPTSITRNQIVFPEDIGKENDDLFWAVMGGSPGNYGVLTHLQMRPLHDDKYPDSRAMRVFTPYTKEKMDKLLQVMTEMSDDPDFPRNFDYCLNLQTDIENSFYFKRGFEVKWVLEDGRWVKEGQTLTRDEEMLLYHPEQYTDGVPWAEEGQLAIPKIIVPMIAIYLSWTNVEGDKECFGSEERKWFEKVRCAAEPGVLDAPKIQANGSAKMEELLGLLTALLPESHPYFNPEAKTNYESHIDTLRYDDPTPMSQLTRYWPYEDAREFALPFEKRVYVSDKTDLSTNGWTKWVSDQVDVIAGGYAANDSLSLAVQFQYTGGKNSEIHRIGAENPQDSSHSFRTETTVCTVLDGFYDPRDPTALPTLLDWQHENDKGAMEGGIFCDKDRRYFWGTYHRPDDKDGGASLDSVWDKYFHSREHYDKLIAVKRKVDPEYVFTANMFGVDASNAPESRKILILPRRPEANETC
jgi:hypothetical protein